MKKQFKEQWKMILYKTKKRSNGNATEKQGANRTVGEKGPAPKATLGPPAEGHLRESIKPEAKRGAHESTETQAEEKTSEQKVKTPIGPEQRFMLKIVATEFLGIGELRAFAASST